MDPVGTLAERPIFEDKMGEEDGDDWRRGRLKFTEMVTGCSSKGENPCMP